MLKLVIQLRKQIPGHYFAGILLNYLINALFIGFGLTPIFKMAFEMPPAVAFTMGFAASAAFQYFRFLIISTPFLTAYKDKKWFIYLIAAAATIGGLCEIWHILDKPGLTAAQFWGAYLSLSFIVLGGFCLEVFFVDRADALLAEVYEREEERKTASKGNVSSPSASDPVTGETYEIEELE
jgi:hypothetical protein